VEKRQKKLTRSTESPQKSFQRSRNWKARLSMYVKTLEYSAEHVEEPFASINDWIKISILRTVFLHCGEDTSMIAASILQARGFKKFQKSEEIGLTLLPKQNYLKLILYVNRIL
jgi:hypothetical protein